MNQLCDRCREAFPALRDSTGPMNDGKRMCASCGSAIEDKEEK